MGCSVEDPEADGPVGALAVDSSGDGPFKHCVGEVWTVGSQEGIRLANVLIDRCAAAVSTATARGEGRGPFVRVIAGERWTPKQLESRAEQQRAVAAARRELAIFARSEMVYEVAEVFTSAPSA